MFVLKICKFVFAIIMTIKGLEAKVLAKKGKITDIEIEGQTLTVPTDSLPKVEVGENIVLHFLVASESSSHEKKLAKAILEEILNGE